MDWITDLHSLSQLAKLILMEFDYNYSEGSLGQFQEHKQVTCQGAEEFGISSLAFDPQEDLLWTATYAVRSGEGPGPE